MANSTDNMGRGQLINRLTSQVGSRNKALDILARRGHVVPGTSKLTPTGMIRNNMTAEERAIQRAAKGSGKFASMYTYNPKTNKATLKK